MARAITSLVLFRAVLVLVGCPRNVIALVGELVERYSPGGDPSPYTIVCWSTLAMTPRSPDGIGPMTCRASDRDRRL